MVIVFYISGHGLGHASRDLELIHAIVRRAPGVRVVVRTAAAPWLFERVASAAIEVQHVETDVGVVQIDSLRLDEEETARRNAVFYRDFERRAEEEAALLARLDARAVIGDIPPLAFAAAARARLPSIAVGNFTWDWIYDAYPAFARAAPAVIPMIRAAYATTGTALRLPLHGGFEPMAPVTIDIPFIARQSTRDPADTRRLLDLPSDRPVVFVSFGAYGAELPLDVLARDERFTLMRPVRHPPPGLEYEDLVAAADVVVTKPGYGIVSECIANDTAVVYTSRGHFVEYDVFVAEMPRWVRCRYLPQEDLYAGRWADAVNAVLAQPAPPELARVDGADVAAGIIGGFVDATTGEDRAPTPS